MTGLSLYDMRDLLEESFLLGRGGKITWEAFAKWRDEKLTEAYHGGGKK